MRRTRDEPKLVSWVATVILFILAIPVVIVLVPFAICWAIGRRVWNFYFHIRHRGQLLFVATTRRGWAELLANNVVCTLPPDVIVVWFGRGQKPGLYHRLLRMDEVGLKRPYLALITPLGLGTVSLHDKLLPMKRFGKRDATVQDGIRPLLDDAVHQLRACWLRDGHNEAA